MREEDMRLTETPSSIAPFGLETARREAESYIANADSCSPELVNLAEHFLAIKDALEEIAGQELTADMSVDDQLGGDFEGAYDHMIEVARTALACGAPLDK